MYIFSNKQLATVWNKICVNCNCNDNWVICYIKTQLKYPKSLKAILRRFLISIKMFFLESPHLMCFLKGFQMLQQNCEQNIQKYDDWSFLVFPDIVNILKRQQNSPFHADKIFSPHEFLVQLVFAPQFKQRHIPWYNYIKRQQQKNPRGIDTSNDPWTRLTCWIKELRNPFVSDR